MCKTKVSTPKMLTPKKKRKKKDKNNVKEKKLKGFEIQTTAIYFSLIMNINVCSCTIV